jgi:hypothetical protein
MSVTTIKRGARAASRRRSAGGAGTPAFRATARGNDEMTGNLDTCTITVPGTVAALDVMCVVAEQNTGSATQTISGGGSGVTWTLRQGPITSASNLRAYLWTARATASSAGATITVTSTSALRFPGLLLVASGVTDTGIVTASAQVDTAGTSHAFPSVTVPSPGGYLLVAMSALQRANAIYPTFTGGVPAGMTLDDESNTNAPANPNQTVSGFHKATTVAAGAQSPGTATSKDSTDGTSVNCKSALFTLAIPPA